MRGNLESRFERYCEPIVRALAQADRRQPAQWYLKGLLLPGERKSVEPMAARVCPGKVRSAHQSMHHLVADAEWDDRTVLGAVAGQVLPELLKQDQPCWWMLDDTGHTKKGTHSVGVARQYCGRLGKTDNCQVAVSLSLATAAGSVPLAYRLYVPPPWAEDRKRRAAAGVPKAIAFRTKGALAREQIDAALAAAVPRGVVLADAAYGDEADFRDWLVQRKVDYVLAVRSATSVGGDPASTRAGTPVHPRAAAHAPSARCRASTGRRPGARPPNTRKELAHRRLACGYKRRVVLALCARAGARRPRQPGAGAGVAADRMAAGRG